MSTIGLTFFSYFYQFLKCISPPPHKKLTPRSTTIVCITHRPIYIITNVRPSTFRRRWWRGGSLIETPPRVIIRLNTQQSVFLFWYVFDPIDHTNYIYYIIIYDNCSDDGLALNRDGIRPEIVQKQPRLPPPPQTPPPTRTSSSFPVDLFFIITII